MRPFPVHVDGLEPQRLGLIVRAVTDTRRAGGLSRAPSMHHHRVMPRGETVRKIQLFARSDCRCDCSIETHVTPTRVPARALATRPTAIARYVRHRWRRRNK